MLLALILAQALSPIGNPNGPIYSQPSLMGAMAQFEAFPSNGRGTFGVCSTTSPTSAQGSALTFTRASNGTCTKTAAGGLATTGIANGDLVVLSSNVARVEYDSAGTLGLLVEAARTNSMLWSEDITNAAYTLEAGATRTADYGTAPDGAATADRLQSGATTGVEQKTVYQTFSVASGAATTCSAFVRSNTTGGTTDICIYDGAAWSCADCVFVAGSHSRCVKSVASGTATSRYCQVGNTSLHNGGVARSANDLLVWGLQGEAGAYATSYIPTTTIAVARARDIGFFDMGASAPPANLFSSALSVTDREWTSVMPNPISTYMGASTISGVDGSKGWSLRTLNSGAAWGCRTADQAGAAVNSGTANLQGTRIWCSGNNSVSGAYGTNSMSASGVQAGTYAAARYLNLGYFGGDAVVADVILSRICVDPDPTRCR